MGKRNARPYEWLAVFVVALAVASGCAGSSFTGGPKKAEVDKDGGTQSPDDGHADPPGSDVTGSFLECNKLSDTPDENGNVLVGCAIVDKATKKKIGMLNCTLDLKLKKKNGGSVVAMQTMDTEDGSPFSKLAKVPSGTDPDDTLNANLECKDQKNRSYSIKYSDVGDVIKAESLGFEEGSEQQAPPVDASDGSRITPFKAQGVWHGGSIGLDLVDAVNPDNFCNPDGTIASSFRAAGTNDMVSEVAALGIGIDSTIHQQTRSFTAESKACFKNFSLISDSRFITVTVADAITAKKQWTAQNSTGRCFIVRVDNDLWIIDRGKDPITAANLLESVRRIGYNTCK